MRNKTSVIIGSQNFSASVPFPFTKLKALDESLDCITFEVINTTIDQPFKPFTSVTFNGDSYVVSQDNVTEIVGTGLFKHEITAIEDTKKAERIICGAKAFTKPLNKKYTSNATTTYYYKNGNPSPAASSNDLTTSGASHIYGYSVAKLNNSGSFVTPVVYDSTTDRFLSYAPSTFNLSQLTTGAASYNLSYFNMSLYYHPTDCPIIFDKTKVTRRSGSYNLQNRITPDGDVEFLLSTFVPSHKGKFVVRQTIRLELLDSTGSQITVDYYDLFTMVSMVTEPAEKSPYTIRQVINTLLETCEPLRKDIDTQRFTLSEGTMTSLYDQIAPEFHFSNGRSLWDNLLEVGKYIHCIPRIKGSTLTYEQLGGSVYADFSKCRVTGWQEGYDIGDYTEGLASVANNLINMDDVNEGSIYDPFYYGYTSLRASEEEYRINDETGLITTKYPIARLIKLECFFDYDGKYITADITPYVFESSEYSSLSSYRGEYPFSKTFALYYTQDGKNIEGLWYKAQDSASSIINSIESYSIINVLSAATGLDLYNKLFDNDDIKYPELCFRVTYMPIVNAFVKAYKTQYDGSFDSLLSYNQSANKLSSKAFGENLRGQLAMLGTTSKTVMAIAKQEQDIPSCGTLYDDENYISQTMTRVFPDYVVSQIILSTEFNQLGSFVETNNAIRQYEIPSAEDRYISIDEFCDIVEHKSGSTISDDDNLIINSTARKLILNDFTSGTTDKLIDVAKVTTYGSDGVKIIDTMLPVVSLAIGTSLYFGFDFDDNVSAGSKSTEGGTDYRIQDYVKYADEYYSQLKYIGFNLCHSMTQSSSNVIGTANILPQNTDNVSKFVYFDTGEKHIIADKDSADSIKMSYQLHFVSSDGYIIGSGLPRLIRLVKKKADTTNAKVYYFSGRINKLNGASTADISSALGSNNVTVDTTARTISLGNPVQGAKSWAIMKGNEFIIGGNGNIPKYLKLKYKRKL